MHTKGTYRWLTAAIALGALLTPIVNASTASAACVKPRKVRIASGDDPSGGAWTAESRIRPNGGNCSQWLLSFAFSFPNAGTWGTALTIPAGGHLSRYFPLSVIDKPGQPGTNRVFSGIVNRDGARLTISLSSGQRITLSPRFPPLELRHRFVWLRSFRYFVFFYPETDRVASVSLFNRAGALLYRTDRSQAFA